jgi:hypothetical protein
MPIVLIIRHFKGLWMRNYLLEGEERESGVPLRISYFGRDVRILNYWGSTLFRHGYTQRNGSLYSLRRMCRYPRNNSNSCDMMIAELNPLTRHLCNHSSGFLLPRWLQTELNVKSSLDALTRNDTQRNIEKYGFYLEERVSETDLRFFFDNMFKPYIESRHTKSTVMVDYSYFRKKFHRNESRLFFLMKDDLPVLGSFNERKNGIIKLSGLGVLNGSHDFLRMGGIRILYYFMFKLYDGRNIERINFGGTSPLISDGLTHFKHSMRGFPTRSNQFKDGAMWIVPQNNSSALKEVLKSNPFVYRIRKKLYRAIFVDDNDFHHRKEFIKYLKKNTLRKLSGTRVFCWNSKAKFSNWIAEEELTDHKVIEIGNFNDMKILS